MKTVRFFMILMFAASLVLSVGLSGPVKAADKVTLTFWNGFTGGDRPAYEGLVKQFNDTHPDIQVNMEIMPWDTLAQKLPAALATGQGPDISTPDYNIGTIWQYAKSGLIAPLDDAYGSGPNQIELSAMPPKVIDGFKKDGKIYAVPANFATLMLYYDKDLLAAAGIASPPKTMDEFRADAVKLTKKDSSGNPSQYGLVLPDHQTIANWPILIWADGGDILNDKGCSMLDDPKTVSAGKSWADSVVSQGISPVGQTGQGSDNLFAAKKTAMEMNGPWAAGQYNTAGINYDVAPIPVGSGGPVTLASTVPMVLTASSKNKDAAYVFFAFWTSKDAQRALAIGSGFPPAPTPIADDPQLWPNPLVAKFAAAAPYARLYLSTVDKFAQIDNDIFSPAIALLN